jgi:hypothetical protein
VLLGSSGVKALHKHIGEIEHRGGNGKLFPVNDIAILQLKNPLNFQPWNQNIRPICLPSPDLNTDSDSYGKPVIATVAGWGNMGYNGVQSKVLRSVDLVRIPLLSAFKL